MFDIKVNGKYSFVTDKTGGKLTVNNELNTADIDQLSANTYHIINLFKSYNAEVISFNAADKTAEIKVNNTIYSLTAKDQFDVLLDQLGLSNLNSAKISDLKAPMPGLVLKVFAAEGSEIKKGENLFVLEAMKMENIIKAPADVIIKSVKLKPGDKVEKGQVLLIFG